jgi:ankyrin repeat protein
MSLSENFAKAIERGNSIQVESLLASGSINVNARLPREHNPPPLVFAAARCDTEARPRVDIVELIVNAGAHIDGVDGNNQTACLAAVYARNVDVLAVLLTRRPNLEIMNNFGDTPLLASLNLGQLDRMSLMLINAGASFETVPASQLCCFASRSTSAIQALLNRGFALNQLRDGKNQTPLHAIASNGQSLRDADVEGVVKLLINSCGVDVEARDFDGETCTHAVALFGRREALRWLIDAGADVMAENDAGQTPLHRVSDYESTVLLLAAGADVDARDHQGRAACQTVRKLSSTQWEFILPVFLAAHVDPSALPIRDTTTVDTDRVEAARRDIAKTRLDLVRQRALQVCVGLQSLGLDALQMCEIAQHSCGHVAHLIAFHQWWTIATTVKHFHTRPAHRNNE